MGTEPADVAQTRRKAATRGFKLRKCASGGYMLTDGAYVGSRGTERESQAKGLSLATINDLLDGLEPWNNDK